MFENHVTGFINGTSFRGLTNLRFINIFNDGRMFEQLDVYHKNSIWFFDSDLFSEFVYLEEINMAHLDMIGYISESFAEKLTNLKYLNLAHN